MPSIVKQTLPEGVSLKILDAVTVEMNVDTDPPQGMIVHTHYVEGGQVRIFDVWENESDYRTFAEQRLAPAMAKVAEQHGLTPPDGPDGAPMDVVEVHRVVRGH